MKKYINTEYIRDGGKKIQQVTIESKHGFLESTNFQLKTDLKFNRKFSRKRWQKK